MIWMGEEKQQIDSELEESMKKSEFRVIMTVEPAIVLTRPLQFKDHNYHVVFENTVIQEFGNPKGFRIIATVKADGIPDAEGRARGLVNQLLSLVSFVAAASLPELVIHRIYNVTPGETQGTFLQRYYELPLIAKSVRNLGASEWNESIRTLAGLPEEQKDPLFRAMHLYRLGVGSRDLLEKYPLYWMGLETINVPLRDYYGLEVEYSKCNKCGHKGAPTLNGVRHHVNEMGDVKWKRFRDLRTGMLHGFKALWEIVPEARALVPKIELVLREGLDRLLGLSGRTHDIPVDLDSQHLGWYETEATIKGPDLSKLPIDTRFDIETPQLNQTTFGTKPIPVIDENFAFIDDRHRIVYVKHTLGSPRELED